MDIGKRLSSILAQHRLAARASHRHPAGTSVTLPTQFAKQLADATKAPVAAAPVAASLTATAAPEPAVPAAETAPAAANTAQPTATASRVAEVVAAALRAVAAPASPAAPSNPGQVVAAAARAAVPGTNAASNASSPKAAVSVAWPARVDSATGIEGPGVSEATDGEVHAANQLKFNYYTDPGTYGVSDISDEGRMFNAAVSRGYVPKTPEGLETMLGWNSMGDFRSDGSSTGRPAAISEFFSNWYSPNHGNLG